MTSLTHITVNRLSPTLGAEVIGLDLKNLSAEEWSFLNELFLEHQVLAIRGQSFEPEEQIAYARRFGQLHLHPAAPSLKGFPEIMIIHGDENSKFVAGNAWHTDVSCDAEPPKITMLYMMDVPPLGGDTLFSSQYHAYQFLDQATKDLINDRTALHSSEHIYSGRYNVGANDTRDGIYPETWHPMVTTHPETGRPVLYVNRAFTTKVEGMDDAEGQALLNKLFTIQERPEFQCQVKWQPGTITMWDDRSTHHYAVWDYFPHRRHGHRVTVAGAKPSR